MGKKRLVWLKISAGFLALALLVTGCSKATKTSLPEANGTAEKLASALATGKLGGVNFDNDLAKVSEDYRLITAGMDGFLPEVQVSGIQYDDPAKQAKVTLHQKYNFSGKKSDENKTSWSFDSTATLQLVDGSWIVTWQPSIVHPDLNAWGRLRHQETKASRAAIVDRKGNALVEQRKVFQVGLDKTQTAKSNWEDSAKKIAKLTGVNEANYVKQVKLTGEKAFVVAITLRAGMVPEQVYQIPGVRVLETTRPLAPTATFADDLLGISGPATAELVKKSEGELTGNDIVGLSGIQLRYDKRLRGTNGHRVDIVQRKTPSFTTSETENLYFKELSAFEAEPVNGTEVKLSLDYALQEKAEQIVNKQPGIASMAVLDLETAGILAAANSPASGNISVATSGRYAPGSTFKLVASLALLRKGFTPNSTVNCSNTATVNGKKFKNYSSYPASGIGSVSLATALALSCNTAFINQASNISYADFTSAAASLGFGVDYQSGYSVFYGSIPETKDSIQWAADMIGQGQIEASPVSMAAVAASVGSGKTAIPWLVDGYQQEFNGTKLSENEAKQLRQLMAGVVNSGTASALKGKVLGAKSGTAEYVADGKTKTHAWMIAYTDHYAIAVMVYDGSSGSKDAAPMIKEFLS